MKRFRSGGHQRSVTTHGLAWERGFHLVITASRISHDTARKGAAILSMLPGKWGVKSRHFHMIGTPALTSPLERDIICFINALNWYIASLPVCDLYTHCGTACSYSGRTANNVELAFHIGVISSSFRLRLQCFHHLAARVIAINKNAVILIFWYNSKPICIVTFATTLCVLAAIALPRIRAWNAKFLSTQRR